MTIPTHILTLIEEKITNIRFIWSSNTLILPSASIDINMYLSRKPWTTFNNHQDNILYAVTNEFGIVRVAR